MRSNENANGSTASRRNQATLGDFGRSTAEEPYPDGYGPTMDRPVPHSDLERSLEGTGLAPSDFELVAGQTSAKVAHKKGFHPDDEDRADRQEEERKTLAELAPETPHPDAGSPRAVADGGTVETTEDSDNSDETRHFDSEEETVTDAWIGSFLYESWGYGQTNVDLAQIVDVSNSGKTVLARMVKAEVVDTEKSSQKLRPTSEHYGEEFRLHVREGHAENPCFRGSYPYIDGEMENGTRMGTFGIFDNTRENAIHETAPNHGH